MRELRGARQIESDWKTINELQQRWEALLDNKNLPQDEEFKYVSQQLKQKIDTVEDNLDDIEGTLCIHISAFVLRIRDAPRAVQRFFVFRSARAHSARRCVRVVHTQC